MKERRTFSACCGVVMAACKCEGGPYRRIVRGGKALFERMPKPDECEIVDLASVRKILDAKKDREKVLAGLRSPGDRIMHMGIDVNVANAPDDYLQRYILPFVSSGAEDIQGRRMTVAEFRDRCDELRRAGFEVIPTCPNVDERGRCTGCPIKIGDT